MNARRVNINLKSVVETVLFVHGEPLSIRKLENITEISAEKLETALRELREEYKNRGFALLEKDGEWQLGSNPQNSEYAEKTIKSGLNEELSRASLETLAVIAYRGPISRAGLEYLRGVNSSFILRNLLLRGLVERVENPKDARSFLYRVSMDFLKHLGLTDIKDLPGFEEFKKTETAEEAESGAEIKNGVEIKIGAKSEN